MLHAGQNGQLSFPVSDIAKLHLVIRSAADGQLECEQMARLETGAYLFDLGEGACCQRGAGDEHKTECDLADHQGSAPAAAEAAEPAAATRAQSFDEIEPEGFDGRR